MATLYQKGFLESIYNIVGNIGSAGLLFLIQLLIIKNLSVEDYGIYNILISIATVGYFVCNLGIESVIERYVPEYIEKNNYYVIKKIIRNGIKISLISSIVVSASLIIFGNFISAVIKAGGIETYFIYVGIILILNIEIKVLESVLNAYIEQKSRNLFKFFAYTTYLGLIYYFFYLLLFLFRIRIMGCFVFDDHFKYFTFYIISFKNQGSSLLKKNSR